MSDTVASANPRFALTVALCFLVAVVEGMDLQAMSAIGPMVRDQLQLDSAQLGLAFSATLIGLGIGATTGGYLADHFGRKRVIVLCAASMSAFTFLTAIANSYEMLFAARVLTGLAIGGAMPNTIVMVEANTDRSKPSAGVVTLMLCGVPAGGILVALAGHLLAESVGWRGIMVFSGIFSLMVAAAAQIWLTEIESTRSRTIKKTGFLDALFGGGRAMSTSLLWILSILSLATVASLATWLPTLAVDKGLGITRGFSTLLAWNLGGVVGILTIGKLCDILGARNALIAAYVGMSLVFVLFTRADTATMFMAFTFIANFFVAGSHYTVYGLSPRLYPDDGAGTGVGANMAIGRIGAIAGPTVIGLFLHAGNTGTQVILGLTPIGIICALCVIGIYITSKGRLDRPALKAETTAPARP